MTAANVFLGRAGGNPNFETTLYTGNGSTQSITTGKNNAAGSLVWIKNRSASDRHCLFDTVNGAGQRISSNLADGEVNTGSNELSSFLSNGFALGSGENVNTNGENYVAWSFLEAAGFFDIVSYTGNGANRTIAHNLGVDVGCIFVKRLNTSANWKVYVNDLGGSNTLQLNDDSLLATESNVWNNANATSSVFSLGTNVAVNENGVSYIAYVFADNPTKGIACGAFNASIGANVSVGFRPQFVIIKNYGFGTALNDWLMQDNKRTTAALLANLSDAEIPQDYVDFTSDGFILKSGRGWNDGSAHIYIAIR